MLGKLFGKRKTVKQEADQIWKSRALEFEGLVAFIQALNPATECALVITQFPNTFRALNDLFLARGLTFKTYPTPFEGARLRDLAEYQMSGYALLVPAQALPDNPLTPQAESVAGGLDINVLVAEHHPLPEFDDRILEFAATLPYSSRVIFHDALDSALIHRFGGDQIAQMVRTMKLPDHESISSPLVDKALRRAQEKIARRVSSPMNADSADQWFQLHLSDGNEY